jgi:hypothetical protein
MRYADVTRKSDAMGVAADVTGAAGDVTGAAGDVTRFSGDITRVSAEVRVAGVLLLTVPRKGNVPRGESLLLQRGQRRQIPHGGHAEVCFIRRVGSGGPGFAVAAGAVVETAAAATVVPLLPGGRRCPLLEKLSLGLLPLLEELSFGLLPDRPGVVVVGAAAEVVHTVL